MKNKGGRPTRLNKKLGLEICRLIGQKYTLRQIEEKLSVGSDLIVDWCFKEGKIYEWFSEQYARAMEIRAYQLGDEILDISDNGSNDWYERDGKTCLDHEHIQRSRVRIDTRKFLIAKVLPKVFGEKLEDKESESEIQIKITRRETKKPIAKIISDDEKDVA